MTQHDAAQAERATQLVATWPDFTAAQLDTLRRIVAPTLAITRAGKTTTPQTGAAHPRIATPRPVRPRGGVPLAAGARALTDSTSALAEAG